MEKIIATVTSVDSNGFVPKKNMLSITDTSQIEFAIRGEQIFDLMINEIKKAKRQVLIQTFVWDKRTKVIKDLQKTLKEIGENKHKNEDENPLDVFVLIDELGSLAQAFYLQNKPRHWPHAPHDLGLGDLPENIRVHVGVHHHNSLRSTHSKTVIVDETALIITGANFQSSNYGSDCNYDAALLLKGEVTQSAFCDFENIWKIRSNASEENISPVHLGDNSNDQPTATVTSDNMATTLYLASQPRTKYHQGLFNILPADPINYAYLTAIENAKHIIRIATPNLNEPLIIEKLVEFINKKEGIVELIMGLGFNDGREKWYGGTNEETVTKLINKVDPEKRKNLNIHWYSNDAEKHGIIHVKFMSIDDQLLIFGSADLDKISLYHCHETNVIVDHANLTRKAIETIFTPAWKTSIRHEKNVSLMINYKIGHRI